MQRHVLYLGKINSSQELAWRRSIEVLDEGTRAAHTLVLFPEVRCEGVVDDGSIVRLKLARLRLERPRQWGACWLALKLRQELHLDRFWGARLPVTRKGTRFDQGACDAGGVSAALAGQRVAPAPLLVRPQRAG